MACFVIYTSGVFIRAWGGGSQSSFSYDNGLPVGDPNRISINRTANHPINTLYINEAADWGRYAHEFGHNVVSAPTSSGDGTATLGEDVYGGLLVDPTAATAAVFELMGAHDSHPLFSGYHLEKLGYYQAANIRELTWDRNAFSQTFDVVAHGLTQDTDANRVHMVKIKVSEALSYYVEVRQRPGATAQVFDDQIPFGGAVNQGGVIVTRAIAGVIEQQPADPLPHADARSPRARQRESAEDPARALKSRSSTPRSRPGRWSAASGWSGRRRSRTTRTAPSTSGSSHGTPVGSRRTSGSTATPSAPSTTRRTVRVARRATATNRR